MSRRQRAIDVPIGSSSSVFSNGEPKLLDYREASNKLLDLVKRKSLADWTREMLEPRFKRLFGDTLGEWATIAVHYLVSYFTNDRYKDKIQRAKENDNEVEQRNIINMIIFKVNKKCKAKAMEQSTSSRTEEKRKQSDSGKKPIKSERKSVLNERALVPANFLTKKGSLSKSEAVEVPWLFSTETENDGDYEIERSFAEERTLRRAKDGSFEAQRKITITETRKSKGRKKRFINDATSILSSSSSASSTW
ncbi:hypothetical protein K432DRAFT_447865 [Lepidopterella palustris CBS 459.81]|uniref:Uncharacterized protein n=1 Tax=Lepidopterella palustris CBS 459.81 TaxID=1314670 RepID=A0A8E2DXK1_9PEZI|nr:hypothetical protein K432DRAFT_447865 [Lepidopterella palustris CBS 459.81]